MMRNLILLFLIQSSLYAQWYQLPNSPYHPGKYEDIYFVNAETGWLLHADGDVYKTTNGGNSWTLNPIDSIAFFQSITALNVDVIFAGSLTPNNLLYKSTDGGIVWNVVTNIPSPQPRGICGLYSLDGQFIFGCGSYDQTPHFIKSTDGGNSWITKDMSQIASGLVDCYFTSRDSGFVVGSIGPFFQQFKSVVLFTSDGGETWVNRYTGDRIPEQPQKISFPDRDNGFVSIERYGNNDRFFLKTTNRGETWTALPFPQENAVGCGFVNSSTGWIGGNFNPTYGTTDGGFTWFNANIGENIMRFRFLSDSIGYACGRYVYKYDKTVGINPVSSVIPVQFVLHQNYPNPFNPFTKIRFEIPVQDNVKLILTDISGKEIRTILNEKLNPGIYELLVSASDMASGIYFYRMNTSRASLSKKLVVIK